MRAKLGREALAWLGLVAVTLAVYTGSILPLDHQRELAYSFDIEFKSFEMHWDMSRSAVLGALLKYRHVMGFAVFFIFAFNAFRKRKLVNSLALSFVFSLVIEISQGFIATRSGQVQDIIANTFGMYLGMIAVYGWREISYAVKSEVAEAQVLTAQVWSKAQGNRPHSRRS